MPGPVAGAPGQVVEPSFFTSGFHLCGSKVQAQLQKFWQSRTVPQNREGVADASPSVHERWATAAGVAAAGAVASRAAARLAWASASETSSAAAKAAREARTAKARPADRGRPIRSG